MEKPELPVNINAMEELGFLANFNVALIKDGITRIVNNLYPLCVLCVLSGKFCRAKYAKAAKKK